MIRKSLFFVLQRWVGEWNDSGPIDCLLVVPLCQIMIDMKERQCTGWYMSNFKSCGLKPTAIRTSWAQMRYWMRLRPWLEGSFLDFGRSLLLPFHSCPMMVLTPGVASIYLISTFRFNASIKSSWTLMEDYLKNIYGKRTLHKITVIGSELQVVSPHQCCRRTYCKPNVTETCVEWNSEKLYTNCQTYHSRIL